MKAIETEEEYNNALRDYYHLKRNRSSYTVAEKGELINAISEYEEKTSTLPDVSSDDAEKIMKEENWLQSKSVENFLKSI